MDKDAAHHANIALNMLQLNDYQLLIDRQEDYLDKPHLLFWSSALSFKIFGVNTFAHRLPALLFALLSIFSTYRLTLHLSDKHTARLAAIMLATAQGFVFSINDARMETPLTAGIIFGLWHLIVYIDKRTWLNLILAALGAAIAFSTKGWIGPVIIFVAAFFYLLLQKKWDVLIAVKTWCFIPALLLFISPVLFAYYHQFDLHPEKVIRGMSDISGVKFILWDQNFERFDGDSFKKGGRNSEYFFFVPYFPLGLFSVEYSCLCGIRYLVVSFIC
ncbi:MAG: glycosyltransferase family 39 protein [Chitinophagaceae bacterium]|nr:glycosyltransferase family 39 protein [Chitinophagaceae bacterium]